MNKKLIIKFINKSVEMITKIAIVKYLNRILAEHFIKKAICIT